ncbi:MAG TPA: hypothetical protein VKR83_02235 [Ktedonobacteraceae bacterium]|nr:hypothetical protein [Ktedonobacteraceae bacterium]
MAHAHCPGTARCRSDDGWGLRIVGNSQDYEYLVNLLAVFNEQREEHGVQPHAIRDNPALLFCVVHSGQCDGEHEATQQRVFSNVGLNLGSVALEAVLATWHICSKKAI